VALYNYCLSHNMLVTNERLGKAWEYHLLLSFSPHWMWWQIDEGNILGYPKITFVLYCWRDICSYFFKKGTHSIPLLYT
jgi:hypothetical protein